MLPCGERVKKGKGIGRICSLSQNTLPRQHLYLLGTCEFINEVMKRIAGKQLWDIRPNVSVWFQVSARNFLLTCFLFKLAPSHKPQVSLGISFCLSEALEIWKDGREREIWIWLYTKQGLVKRTGSLISAAQSTDGRAQNWVVLMSLFSS